MMDHKTDYTFEIVDGVLCIVDLDQGGMSVTNAAEDVLSEIHQDIKLDLPIIYYDTDGNWDGMELKGDKVYFYPLYTTERDVAIVKAKKLWKGKMNRNPQL